MENGFTMIDILEPFVLVFIALLPNGAIDTTIVSEHSSMEACFYAMDEFVIGSGVGNYPMNWDFVCLEDIRLDI